MEKGLGVVRASDRAPARPGTRAIDLRTQWFSRLLHVDGIATQSGMARVDPARLLALLAAGRARRRAAHRLIKLAGVFDEKRRPSGMSTPGKKQLRATPRIHGCLRSEADIDRRPGRIVSTAFDPKPILDGRFCCAAQPW